MMQMKTGASATLEQADEFVVRFRDRRAAPADVLASLAASGVEVLAHSLYRNSHGDLALLLVTNDRLQTALVLQLLGLNYDIEPVVLGRLPRTVGSASLMGIRLAETGVRIQYSYVTWSGGDSLFAVFKTSNDQRAVAACCA